MGTLVPDQEREVAYLSGVAADGTVAEQSYWTWNGDTPATYSTASHELKWGAPSAGSGATIAFAFDPAANWTDAEKAGFATGMALWSEVANVRYVDVSDPMQAQLLIQRGSDGDAAAALAPGYSTVVAGGPVLGSFTHARVVIDTSVPGFGPIGGSLATYGGYPLQTVVHELGHALGLGHAGAYNDGETGSVPMLTSYDSTGWSIMSYFQGDDPNLISATGGQFRWGTSPVDGSSNVALTPMPLDILAVQRLYGMPLDTPLSGGQVFGFNCNVGGPTAALFDFSVDRQPVVTLFDTGGGNVLDLSGYALPNQVTLADGTFSSVGGLSGNVAIAYGTRIDTAIGGTVYDSLHANDDGDVLMGNAGADVLTGGSGNDHIYGNMAHSQQGAADGGDKIDTGGGTNYVNGNGGDDEITAGGVADRIFGGAGNDAITINGSGVNHVNGNAGNDTIYVGDGSNDLRGGQGDDHLFLYRGNNVAFGDAGDDFIATGSGIEVMSGGDGADEFYINTGTSPVNRDDAWAGYHDEITDFTPGVDKLFAQHGFFSPVEVDHPAGGATFAGFADAYQYAQSLMNNQIDTLRVASTQVGGDTYLFYDDSGRNLAITTAIKLDGVAAAQIGAGDFAG